MLERFLFQDILPRSVRRQLAPTRAIDRGAKIARPFWLRLLFDWVKDSVRQFPDTSTNKKNRAQWRGSFECYVQFSALASFELALRLVDHVDAAFATHNTAVTVPVLERAERVLDLHGLSPIPAAPSSRYGQRLG